MFVSGVTDCATPTIAAATIDLVFHKWVGIATIRRVTIFLGCVGSKFCILQQQTPYAHGCTLLHAGAMLHGGTAWTCAGHIG